MRKPFLTIAKIIVALNIVLTACLIIATTTYPSATLGEKEAPIAAPAEIATLTTTSSSTPIALDSTIESVNTTTIKQPPTTIAIQATNKTLSKPQPPPTTTTVREICTLAESRYYGVGFYPPQTLALILGLLLGVSSVALVFEFKTPKGKGYLENAFQTFKIAKTWYTIGLISVSILLAYTTIAFIHVLTYQPIGYSLITYLLLVFEAIALGFFIWRILHIYRLQDKVLKLVKR